MEKEYEHVREIGEDGFEKWTLYIPARRLFETDLEAEINNVKCHFLVIGFEYKDGRRGTVVPGILRKWKEEMARDTFVSTVTPITTYSFQEELMLDLARVLMRAGYEEPIYFWI